MIAKLNKLRDPVLVLLLVCSIIVIVLTFQLPEQSATGYDTEDICVIGVTGTFGPGYDGGITIPITIPTSVPIATPTPMPDDTIHFYADVPVLPSSEYTFSPWFDDVLIINWSGSMTITDALSQTIVISGPATVRFGY